MSVKMFDVETRSIVNTRLVRAYNHTHDTFKECIRPRPWS